MRTMQTHEIGLNAEELQALADGTRLQVPLGDNKRAVLYVAAPVEEPDEPETSEGGMHDEIGDGPGGETE